MERSTQKDELLHRFDPTTWDRLITKARDGYAEATDFLFRKSQAYLWSVYRNHNWEWELSEDEAESIMDLSIAKALKQYHCGYYPAFLAKIFINDVHDQWLRPKSGFYEHAKRMEKPKGKHEMDHEPAGPVDLEAEFILSEQQRLLLNDLSPQRKSLVELLIQGYSFGETQLLVGRSVKDLVYRLRQDLRKHALFGSRPR